MRGAVEELYDYDVVRALSSPTMMIVSSSDATVVLGGSQSLEVLDEERRSHVALRRRRGGGGLVLLQPGDVWIDWWIPANDARWASDVRVTSERVGQWWREVLAGRVDRDVVVHQGAMLGPREYRVACFASRGPGEVFVDDRKAVGVTQWRVREGVFVSTVLPAHSSAPLLEVLREIPAGLPEALDHHQVGTLGLDADEVTSALLALSHPAEVRQLFLIA